MRKVSWIVGTGDHLSIVKSIMNEVLSDHPDYQDIIAAIAVYPAQKWAVENTSKIEHDFIFAGKGIDTGISMKSDADLYYLNSFINMPLFEKPDKLSSRCCSILHNAIFNCSELTDEERKVFASLHKESSSDVSYYYIKKSYRSALEKICRSYSSEVSELMQKARNQTPEDEEIKIVYHDTDDLIRLMPYLKIKSKQESSYIDYIRIVDEIDKAIDLLHTYPYAKGIYEAVKCMTEGRKLYKYALENKKGRKHVEADYAEGIRVLSQLLWGLQAVYITFE